MSDWLSLREARKRDGLRLVLIRGLPSPWSQAARGIFEIKGVPFSLACPQEDDSPGLLEEWTNQDSFPAVAWEDEEPRSGWAEILLLAERLAPEPRLIPAEPERRALLFGAAHEICGEMGLGWARRLQMVHTGLQANPGNRMSTWLGQKYGYRPDSAKEAPSRVLEVLGLLSDLLERSQKSGGRYLLGELSALDVYWATFCNLLKPLPPDLLPLPEARRPMFTATEPEIIDALTAPLLELRDRVYREHLTLPMEL